MAAPRCFCGCGRRAVHRHHVLYEQWLRREAGRDKTLAKRLVADNRNLVDAAFDCHGAHHNASVRYELRALPDSVFEFVVAELPVGPAHGFLERRYAGRDSRLDALVPPTARYGAG